MNAFFIICAVAVLAFVPATVLQTVLATAASTLFESTPFILAGVLLAGAAPRQGARLASLLGCGCSGGPGALAIPVFAATAFALGPLIAVARWLAAFALNRLRRPLHADHAHPEVGSALFSLLPIALAAGVLFGGAPAQLAASVHPIFAACFALAATFCASPCGFGAIALAVTLHRICPPAAAAVLCVAGVCDLRALRAISAPSAMCDAPAYILAALACFLLAVRHGNALVNPRFCVPLFCSAAVLAVLAFRHRALRAPKARWAPALMLLMSIVSAPPPLYVATQTTLGDAFAGEELSVRGALASDRGSMSVVRYTITCCRADAQPVAVRLTSILPERAGQWVLARGRLVQANAALALRVEHYERIAAPADPFMYR